MNRAERRQNNSPLREKVYTMKESQIKSAINKGYEAGYRDGALSNVNKGVDTVIALIIGMPVKVLKEQYSWERADLEKFADKLCAEFSVFADGKMKQEDYVEYLKTAIDMEFETYSEKEQSTEGTIT